MEKDIEYEHNIICDTDSAIDRMKKEVENLNEMIKGYEAYSDNTLFASQLRNLKQRMLTEINIIDKNFKEYVDYNICIEK